MKTLCFITGVFLSTECASVSILLLKLRFGKIREGRTRRVIIPPINQAKAEGINSRGGLIFALPAKFKVTGIKIATAPVEFIKSDSPETTSINRTSSGFRIYRPHQQVANREGKPQDTFNDQESSGSV